MVSSSSGYHKDSWKDEFKQLKGLDLFVLLFTLDQPHTWGLLAGTYEAKEEFPLLADVWSGLQGLVGFLSLRYDNNLATGMGWKRCASLPLVTGAAPSGLIQTPDLGWRKSLPLKHLAKKVLPDLRNEGGGTQILQNTALRQKPFSDLPWSKQNQGNSDKVNAFKEETTAPGWQL